MPDLQASQWLQLILLGGVAGTLGQGARMVVGLKKLSDEASARNTATRELVEPSRILVSLAIGFIAGAIAAMATSPDLAAVTRDQVLALAAAGYAGTDFIEGIMSRFVSGGAPAVLPSPAATAPQTVAATVVSAGAPAGSLTASPARAADDFLG